MTKDCTRCGATQPLSEFYKRTDTVGVSYTSWCRTCQSEVRIRNDKKRPDLRRANQKRYYATDKGREIIRKWHRHKKEQKPDLYREIARRGTASYRARKRALPATLTQEEWEDILFVYDHRCIYCWTPNEKLEQDHWIPASKGGGYTIENIVPACRSCNAAKGDFVGRELLNGVTS